MSTKNYVPSSSHHFAKDENRNKNLRDIIKLVEDQKPIIASDKCSNCNASQDNGGKNIEIVVYENPAKRAQKEGIEYLEKSGEDTLLKLQGLKDAEKNGKPPAKREGTMTATAKEGETFLEGSEIDPDAQTRGQQKEKDAQKVSPQKHKLTKDGTMVSTAKEGEQLLAGSNIDADAHTRSQQQKLDAMKDDEPSEKKARLSKEGTMQATAKEGKEFLGSDEIGESRSETKELNDSLEKKDHKE